MPGSSSPDFAATQILSDVLGSPRGNLYELVPAGKAIDTGFGIAEAYPKASVAYSAGVLAAGSDAAPLIDGNAQNHGGLCGERRTCGIGGSGQAARNRGRGVSA